MQRINKEPEGNSKFIEAKEKRREINEFFLGLRETKEYVLLQ